jgi:hypothetical protein
LYYYRLKLIQSGLDILELALTENEDEISVSFQIVTLFNLQPEASVWIGLYKYAFKNYYITSLSF